MRFTHALVVVYVIYTTGFQAVHQNFTSDEEILMKSGLFRGNRAARGIWKGSSGGSYSECEKAVTSLIQDTGAPYTKISIFLDKEETATLSCSLCMRQNESEPVKWWKIRRRVAIKTAAINLQTMFPDAVEVDVDIHEDPRHNRVYIDRDRNLIIKSLQPGDEGHYFCQKDTVVSRLETEVRQACARSDGIPSCLAAQQRLATGLIENKVHLSQRFILIYNLDVELDPPSIRKVGKHLGAEAYPHYTRRPAENLLIYSQWAGWSECSAECRRQDDQEENFRQRRGKCMVHKLNEDLPVKPFIIQEVMSSNADVKVACHSTLFRDNEDIFNLPDEMEYEKCATKICADYNYVEDNSNISPSPESGDHLSVTEFVVIRETLNIKINDNVKLRCPGASPNKQILWFNESKLYGIFETEEIRSRVEINAADGSLTIGPVTEWDGVRFACWMEKRNRAMYTLVVEAPEPIQYSMFREWLVYLLLYETGLFLIFLVILIVRTGASAKPAAAGVYQKQDMTPLISSSSDQNDSLYDSDEEPSIAIGESTDSSAKSGSMSTTMYSSGIQSVSANPQLTAEPVDSVHTTTNVPTTRIISPV